MRDSCWRVHRSPGLFLCFGGWVGGGGVITFLLLRSLGLFFCYLFLCYACRLPHHLYATRRAFQESWNTSHWQKVEGIERLFAKQLPPKDQWPTWQPGQPSDEKACLSVLLAQFAAIAQPSTVLKTPGKVAMQKKNVAALVCRMMKTCHLCLTSDFQWAEYLDNGFATRRLMVPWPNS